MKISSCFNLGFLRRAVLAALPLAFAASAFAQAQFAGTYIGTINTRVSVGGFTVENSLGGYIAVVSSDGQINLSGGALTGTVSAAGAVTFTGGTQLAALGLTSATISSNALSSQYGALVANGTSQYKLNPSSSFTPSTGGGGGGGGGGTSGDLLAYYSFNDTGNLLKDDSGRSVTLIPVNGAVSQAPGRVGGALQTNKVRLRALVNSTFSVTTMSLSYFVKVQGAGDWNPRMVAVQLPGSPFHYYGAYLEGASTSARRYSSYHRTSGSPRIYSTPSNTTLPTGNSTDWTHVAVTHDGSNVRIYHNGTLVVTQSNAGAMDRFSTAMLSIAGSDNGLDLFQGLLDEVRIYNRALTATEVTTLANGGNVGTAVTGAGTTAAITADVIAAPTNLVGYRNRIGQSFQLSVTGASSGSAWGTDIYTDDSTVARAAVHAGVVAVGETKTVTVSILPGQSSYTASTRNGVTTGSWGAWTGSFSFAGAQNTTIGQVATQVPALASGFVAANLSVVPGGRLVLPISVSGIGPFSFQWFLNGSAIAGATSNPYVIDTVTAAQAGAYTVRVTNAAGAQIFNAGSVTVAASASAPQIVLQPFDKVVSPGGTFALATSAGGSGLSYQWFRNGAALAGETGAILLRSNVNSGDAGQYTVRVSNSGGSVTSNAGNVTIDANASRLSNLSGRINLGGNDKVIPAFTISGSGKKRVLIRAVGPTLGAAPFGLPGIMADPKLELYDGGTKIAENDNYAASVAPVAQAVGGFPLLNGSKDAALVIELDAGKGYTIHIFSANGEGGVVLFEVYDAGNVGGGSKFTNVALRGPTGTGNNTLILGFYIDGVGKRTLLARGVGPQLVQYGVNHIADPKLEIFDHNGRSVLTNDDWGAADFVAEMLQAREFVGAFALDGGSSDASTLTLLDPGSYTMQITAGSGTATGEALVELYEVP